jgi:tripartite-type tricarboxylate transporter receptor subunit TctC
MRRARAAFGLFALILLPLLTLAARGEGAYPSRTVTMMVPFPAGGLNDILARILADKLQAKWGQPVVVENKTGAGGNIGAEFAAKAEPDGYTLFPSAPGPLAINPSLYRHLSYRAEDFIPITVLGAVPNLIIVRPGLGVNSVAELIEHLKKNPGQVTMGSQGKGSTPHLTGVLFMNRTGTQMIHVPYRGETLIMNDMLGGHVDLFFGNISPALGPYRAGKVKILAVLDHKRAAVLPEVPTIAEAGLAGLISTSWFALAAPAKTPGAIIEAIAVPSIEALRLPEVGAKTRAIGAEPVGNTPAEAAAFIKDEIRKWNDVIVKNGVTID